MFECFPYDPDHFTCFVDATRIRIAARRIAELYKDTATYNYGVRNYWPEEVQRTGDEPI